MDTLIKPDHFISGITEIINKNKSKSDYELIQELKSIIESVVRITGKDITSAKRSRNYTNARLIYSYMARRFTKCTFSDIGRAINRHHATILHLNKNYSGIYKTDDDFRELADRCLSAYFSEIGVEQPKVEAIEDINKYLNRCDIDKLLSIKNYSEKILEHGN